MNEDLGNYWRSVACRTRYDGLLAIGPGNKIRDLSLKTSGMTFAVPIFEGDRRTYL